MDIRSANRQDARREYEQVCEDLEMLAHTRGVVWNETPIRDEENRVVVFEQGPPEAFSLFYRITGGCAVLLTVWAETPIGKIPVLATKLDDGYGPHAMGYRAIDPVATRYIFEVRPSVDQTAPILSLAVMQSPAGAICYCPAAGEEVRFPGGPTSQVNDE